MRAVGPVAGGWPVATIGAYLTRTLRQWLPEADVDLLVVPASAAAPPGAVAARRLGNQVLVAGTGPVAVEWRWVERQPSGDPGSGPAPDAWAQLAADLAAGMHESAASAAARVRVCQEVLARCRGGDPDAAVVAGTGPAGWIRLTSGRLQLLTTVVATTTGGLAACVAVDSARAG
jgi:hypothetical protein